MLHLMKLAPANYPDGVTSWKQRSLARSQLFQPKVSDMGVKPCWISRTLIEPPEGIQGYMVTPGETNLDSRTISKYLVVV